MSYVNGCGSMPFMKLRLSTMIALMIYKTEKVAYLKKVSRSLTVLLEFISGSLLNVFLGFNVTVFHIFSTPIISSRLHTERSDD